MQDGLRPATWTADAMVGLASQWRYYKPEGCQVGESDERLRDNQCQLFFEQECGPSPPNFVATKLQTWGRFFLYSCDQNRKAVLSHAMMFSRASPRGFCAYKHFVTRDTENSTETD